MSTPTTNTPAPAAATNTSNTAKSSNANTTPAAKPGEASTTPTTTPKAVKIKVEGREIEVSEADLMSYAQQGFVAQKRFQEASRLKREAEEMYQAAKADPEAFFKKTGMSAREWAEKYLVKQLEAEAMSPEQRKAAENEAKLREYEKAEKARKEQQEAELMKRLTNEQREKYDKLFTEALGKSGLPKTPFTVRRMAELQKLNLKMKFELNADQLAKVVREDYMAEHKALHAGLTGEQLIELLGIDGVKKLTKAQIAKLKAKPVVSGAEASRPTKPRSDEPQMSWNEYRRKNRGRL